MSTSQIVTAVAFIVIGIMFCAFRSGMLSILLTVVGVVAIAMGIFDTVKKQYAKGITEVVVGIIIIACSWTVVEITLLLLGVAFIGFGIYMLVKNAPAMSEEKGINKIMVILNPILVLIFGILLFAARWAIGDAICIVLGVIAIINGILMLVRA
ncbi:MAG: DUF308 domain-containing protein [Clostridia bacterium]